jgi:hypothetical protein
MPEQAEWQPDDDNANDYRWHPHYARRRVDDVPQYDTRTIDEKFAELQIELRRLRAMVLMQVGEL